MGNTSAIECNKDKCITTCKCDIDVLWNTAVELLNSNNPRSKKAESYLIEQGFIDPQQVNSEMAKFIFNRADTMPKRSLWNYIRCQDNDEIARAFINLLDLSNLPAGLKIVFEKLNPDHAIENFLEVYSEEFAKANPRLVRDADTSFFLVYETAVLMASMSTRRNVQSKADWINGLRTADGFSLLADQLLEEIYDSAEQNLWVVDKALIREP